MLEIGVRAHDLGSFNEQELSDKLSEYKFSGIQLVFKKAINHEVNKDSLVSIKQALSNTKIFMVGGYFNMINNNIIELNKSTQYFKEMIDSASFLNASYVGTETGFLGSDAKTSFISPTNEENINKVVELFEDFCLYAKNKNVEILAEGAYNHTAKSVEVLYEIERKVDSNLGIIIDIYNYLNLDNYNDYINIFDKSIKLFGSKIKILHLKDFIIRDNKMVQVGLGNGLIDYKLLLSMVKNSNLNPILIFEGVKPCDLHQSYEYINNILEELYK